MNYRHGFHAGNHADVLKHVALLAICNALTAKPAPIFALDTHAGRGLYQLTGDQATRTGEAEGGIGRLRRGLGPAIDRYLDAVAACRARDGGDAYPGSPWLLAYALRAQDRIAACELQAEEAHALKANFADEPRIAVHARDGYAAMKALLPPRFGDTRFNRGLVLIDPPFEQADELKRCTVAVKEAIGRMRQTVAVIWYPIKDQRLLTRYYQDLTSTGAPKLLRAELYVHHQDSPQGLNGSGLAIANPPWGLEEELRELLPLLAKELAQTDGSWRLDWLIAE